MRPNFLYACACLIVFACLTFSTLAQKWYGAKAGINFATIDHYYGKGLYNSILKTRPQAGISFSLFHTFKRFYRFSWSYELNYSMRNSSVTHQEFFRSSTHYEELELRYAYVNFALLPQLHFLSANNLYVNAGPYLGFRTYSWVTGTQMLYDPQTNSPTRLNYLNESGDRYFPAADYGFTGGIGIELPLGQERRILLEIKDYFGLGNMVSKEKPASANTILFNIGYIFGRRDI